MHAEVNRTANFTPQPPIGEFSLSLYWAMNASAADGGQTEVENLIADQLPLHNNTFAL